MGLRWKNQTDRLPRLFFLFQQLCPHVTVSPKGELALDCLLAVVE